jgi:hypothetical protein
MNVVVRFLFHHRGGSFVSNDNENERKWMVQIVRRNPELASIEPCYAILTFEGECQVDPKHVIDTIDLSAYSEEIQDRFSALAAFSDSLVGNEDRGLIEVIEALVFEAWQMGTKFRDPV